MNYKKLLSFIILLFISTFGIAQDSKVPIYTSPIVNQDRTVLFNIYAPKAREINLIGSIQEENIPLIKDENGLWSVTIGPLQPEIYHYQFNVDGAIIMDTKNQSPYPWLDGKSELIVPGSPRLLHELTNVPHGSLHNHLYFSKTTGKSNSVRVYTPPNYNPNDDKKYPIIFLLHGFGEKVSFWSDFGKINLITDNLIAQNDIVSPIIVMPNGDPLEAEYYKFFTADIDGNKWMIKNKNVLEKDLINDLLPFLEKNYQIKKGPNSTAICGSSMGGIQAVLLGLDNLDTFGWVIGLSTSLEVPMSIKNLEAINSLNLFQLNIGKQDIWGFNQSNKVHDWFVENNVKHEYIINDGGHDWDIWRKDMISLLPQLFR